MPSFGVGSRRASIWWVCGGYLICVYQSSIAWLSFAPGPPGWCFLPVKASRSRHLLTVPGGSKGPGICTQGQGRTGDSAALMERGRAGFGAEMEWGFPAPPPPHQLPAPGLTLLSGYLRSITWALVSHRAPCDNSLFNLCRQPVSPQGSDENSGKPTP